jgi:hypothetical protein
MGGWLEIHAACLAPLPMPAAKKKSAKKSVSKPAGKAPAKPSAAAAGPRMLQLKVVLVGSNPPIWRGLLVPTDLPLEMFHHTLQFAMGWEDCHMHQFIQGKTTYVSRMVGVDEDYGECDEGLFTVGNLLGGRARTLFYVYDFGDSWVHHITREKILPLDPAKVHPECLAGELACPPEDCGGIFGYYHMLEVVGNPRHPEHEDIVSWIGRKFDPAAFDLAKTNRTLRGIELC